MDKFKIVIDTNVIISGLHSSSGKSYELLQIIDDKNIRLSISIPLILEYEEVLLRKKKDFGFNKQDIDNFLDYFCKIANQQRIFYLWRSYLKDLKDDMVLELAFESQSDYIITYNIKDFKGIEKFGIQVITPYEFLKKLENTI
ncbi:MAG: putative toxin-antitoxin system toxin component, PIN family [Gammaproteobacteria bacterium]|nr:MAG: putative toxin-antitoxin system toxin component, PIN family [Gammaproteobacteria bacterium]